MTFVYAGQYGPSEILNLSGFPLKSIPINVYEPDGVTLAPLWTDRTKVTAAPNPLTTDTTGNLTFWADPGIYIVSGNGQTLPVALAKDAEEPGTSSANATSIQGVAVATTAPASGDVIGYNGTEYVPVPGPPPGALNVLQFGTNVGTGNQLIDDAAIAAMIAASVPGDCFYFPVPPSGQYLTAGNISIPAFRHVYADAWSGTNTGTELIKLINGSGASCVFGSISYLTTATAPGSDTGILIENLSIDVNGTNNPTTHGIVLCGNRCVQRGNYVYNAGQSGIVQSDANYQGNTSQQMVCQENRIYDNTIGWPSTNVLTPGQHGIWWTHTTGAHDNSDSWIVDNVVFYSGDNSFQFDSAGDLVIEGNHPWGIMGPDAFYFNNVNRCRISNNIVDNFGFNSGVYEPTAVNSATPSITVNPAILIAGWIGVGTTLSGPGITGTATISAVNTSTGICTLTGTIGTLVVGAYVFDITYRGIHFASLNGTNDSTDDHSATHLTGNQIHSNENNHNGYGAISATVSTAPTVTGSTAALTVSSTKAGEVQVGWLVTEPTGGTGLSSSSVITAISGTTIDINGVTGALPTGSYTFTPPGGGNFVYLEVDSVSGTSTIGVLQLAQNTYKQDVAGGGTSTAYSLAAGSNTLIVLQVTDDARGPTLVTVPVTSGSVTIESGTAGAGGTLPITLVTTTPYQALATDCIMVCESGTAETIVTPLTPLGGQVVEVTNPGSGLISISPSPGQSLPGVTTRSDSGCSLSGTTLVDASLVSSDVDSFAVHANIPIGTTIISVIPGTSAQLSNAATTGGPFAVRISAPLEIYNNQAIQLVWDSAHNAWRFLSRAIASLGGGGFSTVGGQLNTLTSTGAVSNILDDGSGNMSAAKSVTAQRLVANLTGNAFRIVGRDGSALGGSSGGPTANGNAYTVGTAPTAAVYLGTFTYNDTVLDLATPGLWITPGGGTAPTDWVNLLSLVAPQTNFHKVRGSVAMGLAGAYGASSTYVPPSTDYTLDPHFVSVTWGGTFSAETVNVQFTVTYTDTTTATFTAASSTSAQTLSIAASTMQSFFKDGVGIVEIAVQATTTKTGSTAVTCGVTISGLNVS